MLYYNLNNFKKHHITIIMSLLTRIKINVSVINATGCLQMLSISLLTPSEPFVTNQYAEDYWMSTLLISGSQTTAHICVVHVWVIHLREIALSSTVLDANTLSAININIRQILNIFPYPWYRPMGIKLFIMPICRPEEKCLTTEGEKIYNTKLKQGEKVGGKICLVTAYLFPAWQYAA